MSCARLSCIEIRASAEMKSFCLRVRDCPYDIDRDQGFQKVIGID
jgi:hypothetical protein